MVFLDGNGNRVVDWGVLDGGNEESGDLGGAWGEKELQRRWQKLKFEEEMCWNVLRFINTPKHLPH